MILGTGRRIDAFRIALIGFVVLCLCVSSWGSCYERSPIGPNGECRYESACCKAESYADLCNQNPNAYECWRPTCGYTANVGCSWERPSEGMVCIIYSRGRSSCASSCCGDDGLELYGLCCGSIAEADSVACVNSGKIWQNGQCQDLPKDSVDVCENETTIQPDGSLFTQMGLFQCPEDYKSLTDCKPRMLVPGTCSQNGYQPGPQNSNKDSLNVNCFASFDGNCYMEDKSSGNTFSCGCQDNDCNSAYNSLASGNCSNPYASSNSQGGGSSDSGGGGGASSSSANDGGGLSSSQEVGSSNSQGGGSSGSGGGGDGNQQYDYRAVLDSIKVNTRYVGYNSNFIRANTQEIASNVDYTNTLLKQSDANRAAENAALIAKYDDMIGEVQSIGNILNSPADVGTLPDTAYNINYDTLSIDTAPLPNIDSLVSMNQAWLDSFQHAVDSINDPDMHDTIGLTEIYDFSDTNEIRQKLSDFFFPGAVSNTCPVLDHTIHWPEPMGNQRWYIDFGNLLGKFDICAFTRWVVRLFTTIAIIFGSFKAVMRAFGGGSDE